MSPGNSADSGQSVIMTAIGGLDDWHQFTGTVEVRVIGHQFHPEWQELVFTWRSSLGITPFFTRNESPSLKMLITDLFAWTAIHGEPISEIRVSGDTIRIATSNTLSLQWTRNMVLECARRT